LALKKLFSLLAMHQKPMGQKVVIYLPTKCQLLPWEVACLLSPVHGLNVMFFWAFLRFVNYSPLRGMSVPK